LFIYLIVNRITGKYYVGQHKGNNLRKYLQQKLSQAVYELKRKGHGRGSHLFASMRKHPKEAWSIHALLSGIKTRAELDQKEKDFISFLRSQDPQYGYNICRGGEGFTGPCSEEHKRKISLALTGRKHTPEAIAKMRQVPKTAAQLACLDQTGVKRSPETITKCRKRTEKQQAAWAHILAHRHHSGQRVGFRHSEEAKEKMRLAKRVKASK
jgi:hypothetical protein